MIVSRQSPEKNTCDASSIYSSILTASLIPTRLAVTIAKLIDTNKQCNQK